MASQNPYDFINDVKDPKLFAGRRSELDRVKEELARLASMPGVSPVLALVGERRVGKTSLLHRISEIARSQNVLPAWIHLNGSLVSNAWEYWHEVLQAIVAAAYHAGAVHVSEPIFGFQPTEPTSSRPSSSPLPALSFGGQYAIRQQSLAAPALPPSVVLSNDLTALLSTLADAQYSAVLLMFDEAHVLAESVDLLQQLRHIVRMTGLIGVVFAGEPAMNKMFTTKSSPFYLQATVIPVENFVTKRDIGECAILPLSEAERPLMSPMTIDYLARLTQGKPNQIRLICYSIYRRYLNGQQRDLDITIEALDDVLDTIQASYASEYDLKDRIERVRRLSSVDLEALYLATRYPDWRVDDIVALDEAFRGEQMSPRAVERRRSLLNEKHGYFVSMSLLQDRPDKYILAGDEFLYLYLRFWYEVRKYGELRRRLEIGEEPITPFGEKVDKLIRSLAWEVRQPIALVSVGFAHGDAPKDKFIHHIKQRFSAVDNLLAAKPFGESEVRLVLECFRICQMIRRAGRYYLLVIAVRDLQNPRESILAEVYFNCEQPLVFPLRIIRQQAEAARILVEEFEAWTVEVPTLAELVRAVSGTTLEELLARLGPFEQWTMKSIQRFIESGPGVKRKEETEASASKSEWIELYQRGKTDAALAALSEGLAKDPKRPVAARLYNDRGYIRYEMPGQTEAAIRDLERALDLHHGQLALTLLNVAVAAIDSSEFTNAIKHLKDALLITHGKESVSASYLRMRLLGSHLLFARREKWEQRPANVIEAAYVNLAYALTKLEGHEASLEVLQEGLELLPSSVRIKHALARWHLSQRRAALADPIYEELLGLQVDDPDLRREIEAYRTIGQKGRRRS